MALTGYNQKYLRKNGGLKTIALIDIGSVESAIADPLQKSFTKIILKGGDKFTPYRFREDEAEYKENITRVNGNIIVAHEISFSLDKMGGETSFVIGELVKTSQNGLAAIVTTANDDSFLVGYSLEFKREHPLKLASVKGTTGKKLSDATCETIVLRSEDISKALPYGGPMTGITA